jgi:hypothetical protein
VPETSVSKSSSTTKWIIFGIVLIVLVGIIAACTVSASHSRHNSDNYGYAADGYEYDYDGLCRDKVTNKRVNDDKCENDRRHLRYAPVYLRHGQKAPRIGKKFVKSSFVDSKPTKTRPNLTKRPSVSPSAATPTNPSTGATPSATPTKQGFLAKQKAKRAEKKAQKSQSRSNRSSSRSGGRH